MININRIPKHDIYYMFIIPKADSLSDAFVQLDLKAQKR